MSTLTKRQKQILDYVERFIKKEKYSPSLEEIGKHFGLFKSTIHQHIEELEEKGYLRKIKLNYFFKSIREFKEFILDGLIGNFIESILRKVQQRRIGKDPLTYQSGGRVVFSDKQLEFHPNSPEKWILEKYNQRMKELGLKELGNEKDSGLIK